tara:strand:- start:7205 stop:8983 length:1779 start_codon:yes stop_codon:yes gene_type:complete
VFFSNFTERAWIFIKNVPVVLSFVAFLAIFYDFGFDQSEYMQQKLILLYQLSIFFGITWTIGSYLRKNRKIFPKVLLFDIVSVLAFAIILIHNLAFFENLTFLALKNSKVWLYIGVALAFFRMVTSIKFRLRSLIANPAQIFILSFLSIIFVGAFLLILPNASVQKLSFIDALFTSTSAVCVTGLIVVDTGSYFTLFGQSIILALIQIGGLGIMTFASYFSYFFRGVGSFNNQLMLKDMSNSNKLGEVFSTLKKIIIITFSIEIIGAALIFGFYYPIENTPFFEQLFFSIFHSVSAFCNAGFSTLTDSLHTDIFRFNYSLQIIIIVLFTLGGLGFPIVFNLLKYINYLINKRLLPFLFKRNLKKSVTPWVINLNSRITLITSFVLIIFGTVVFYLFELNNSLTDHTGFGKVIISLFSATTPRTAGFNVVDTSALNFSTIMLIFLLMWVGASPASTGGGIKTSTFAIATLNFWSLAKGKDRIEIFRREVAEITIRRAFAIISLSLVVIGSGIFLIAFFDSEKDLLSIAFECFSAYSTVGLSIGITNDLSIPSKLVIIAIMLIGRVSMLTILIALFRKEKFKNYQYPEEELLIN